MKNTGTILVVDDNLGTLKMMIDILQAEGYQARPANSGELALQAMDSQLPDLLLLDIRMPGGLDGFEVCRRLKANERTRHTPVIFLSAEADQKERVEVFGLGAVDFVSKPFHREELLARISTHLELWRLRQHLEQEVARRTKELEQRNLDLQRALERLSLATQAARIGIWDWDIVKDEIVWDDSMYELYDIRREDFGGAYEAWSRTIHPADKMLTEEEIHAALRGEREYAPEFRIITPNGSIRYIKADSRTFLSQDCTPLRMVGVNIDITERKRAEEAFVQLNKELEQKNHDLELMIKSFVERELKMVELKGKVKELEKGDCDRH